MTHTRIRKFNTGDTYPEQNLDNDLCQAVVAGNTVYLRGQVAQDLEARHHPRDQERRDQRGFPEPEAAEDQRFPSRLAERSSVPVAVTVAFSM